MANIETKETPFQDLGKFKSIECEKIMNIVVCKVKFAEGNLTLSAEELNKLCEEQKCQQKKFT